VQNAKHKTQSYNLKLKANSKIIPNYFKVFQIIPNQYQNPKFKTKFKRKAHPAPLWAYSPEWCWAKFKMPSSLLYPPLRHKSEGRIKVGRVF